MPRLVLVHDRIGGSTGMGRVAAFMADTALNGGWEVRLVASEVVPELAERCVVTSMPHSRRSPQQVGAVRWYAQVLRRLRTAPGDVVHVHAPALLRAGDVMTCHHLASAARRHGVRVPGGDVAALARRTERAALIAMDEICYRRRPARTRMTFVSEFLREQFRIHYGDPTDGAIITPPAPPWRGVTRDERTQARQRYGVVGDGVVVGYLGGDDQRKGVAAVRDLVGQEGLELLVGGPGSDRLAWPGVKSVGYVDVDDFVPACDVVVAPALFDAAPTAVTQALARGVPVVVRQSSGWAGPLAGAGAGVVWDGRSPLSQAVRAATRVDDRRCREMTVAYSRQRQGTTLLEVYERVLEGRKAGVRMRPIGTSPRSS